MSFNESQFGLKSTDVVGFTALQRTATEMQVTVSVANEATWLYKNRKPPRYRNSYGFAQVMSGAFVVREVQLQYLNQEILHWRATEFGTNDAVVCGVRTIGRALDPPREIAGIVVPTRQRYTSVRFRLYPGVEANVGLKWELPASGCLNTIEQPDPGQGNPIRPNNGSADPGARPDYQGGDPLDTSDNDGDKKPDDGKAPAPSAGNGSNFPHWHAHFTSRFPPNCGISRPVNDFPAHTNPDIAPAYTSEGNSQCDGTTYGKVRIGGAIVLEPDDVVSVQFLFY